MSSEAIERRFREIGVPLRVSEGPWFRIDVTGAGSRGRERIALNLGEASVQVMDADRDHQQLLLLVKDTDGWRRPTTRKILCGRDERSLFVVTVPNPWGVAVNTVRAAHEALKPDLVRQAEADKAGGRGKRGPAWVRQGDWFFLPYPWIPLDRAGARRRVKLGFRNPHIVDYLTGDPGRLSNGLGRVEGPVFARGFVRHREHKPLNLRVWHRVVPNTAIQAPGGYLD